MSEKVTSLVGWVLAAVVLGVAATAALLALWTEPASSAAPTCTVSWTTAASGSWSDGASWSTGTVPGELDDVCIGGAGIYTVTINGEISIRSLTLGGAAGTQTLLVSGGSPAGAAALSLATASTIEANGSLDLDSSDASASAALVGPVVNNGSLRLLPGAGGPRYLQGSLTNARNGSVLLGSGSPSFLSASVVNDGSVIVDAGGDVEIVRGSFDSNPGSTISLSGSLSTYGTPFTQAGGAVSGGAVVLDEGSSLIDSAGTGAFLLRGDTVLSGTIPVGQTVTVQGRPESGAVAEIPGPVTNNGTLELDGSGHVAVLEGAGSLTNNGVLRALGGVAGFRILGVDLTNASGATVKVDGLPTVFGGPGRTITNHGSITVGGAGGLFVDQATFLSNPGSTLQVAGVAGTHKSTFAQRGGTLSGKAVELRSGSTLEYLGGSGSFELLPGYSSSDDQPNVLRGTIPAGQTVTVRGTADGDASVSLASSAVGNNGTLALDSSAPGASASLSGSPLVNNGTLATVPGAGGQRRLGAPITNTINGTVALGTTTLVDDVMLANHGRLTLEDDVDLIFTGGLFTNGPGGTLAVTVNAATGASAVVGTSAISLDGTLEVSTIGAPVVGAIFSPVTGLSRTGTFRKVTLGVAAYEAAYTATGVDLVSAPPRSRFVPLRPIRLLDTRIGNGAPAARLGAGGVVTLTVAGRGGVPASGASSVALTVTAVHSSPGFATVWPAGQPRPGTSNLNTSREGQTVAVQVVVPVGAEGKVSLLSSGGGHLVADVAGWYEPVATATSGRFGPLAPSRLLDTRNGTGALAGRRPAGASVALPVVGRGGVPGTGVSAVVLSLTAVDSSPGFVTAWPGGLPRPTASNLNTDLPGQTSAAHVVVPVGADGSVALYTSGGGHLLADVVGWFTDATAPAGTSGLYVGLAPVRRLDTRIGQGVTSAGSRPAQSTVGLLLGGSGGIPGSGVAAVVANLTAVDADPTFLTAWAGGVPRPLASNVNVTVVGDTAANLVTAPVGGGGLLHLFTYGAAHLLLDTFGYYQA